jgi:sugar phosphate isomerase/epimerase
LRKDFASFKRNKIDTISLSLYWFRIETGFRTYNDKFLNDVKRVCNVANEFDIDTMVTLHTLLGSDSSSCTPGYAVDPIAKRRQSLGIARAKEPLPGTG